MRRINCGLSAARAAGALLLTATMAAGCGGKSTDSPNSPNSPNSPGTPSGTAPPAAVAQAKEAGSAVDPAIVSADNGFGLRLFQTLNSGAAGNVAISPISVAMALQILYNGAAGTTQQAMAQTLQLGSLSAPAHLNSENAALQASLISADPQVILTVANSLWMHLSDNHVLPSFTQTDETYYGATVGDLSGAPANVNAWVSTATNGLIAKILPDEPPDYYATVTAVLANTIYFKGQWSTEFDPGLTAAAPFTLSGGAQVSVAMMHQTGSYAHVQGPNFQAVRLPYGQGRFSMLIVLPDSSVSLNAFVAGMTLEGLNGWISQLQTSSGNIALPRFTAKYTQSLPPALSSLGMGVAFCPNTAADFSQLAALTCIADVEHATVVEVDETGTVAAGATIVTVVTTAVELPFVMTMDRPFLYAIRDDKTGELLFIGALQNPS
jgi:serine protease inhibitor